MIIRVFQKHSLLSCLKRPLPDENWFMTSIELLCLVGPGFLSIFEKKIAGGCNDWINPGAWSLLSFQS